MELIAVSWNKMCLLVFILHLEDRSFNQRDVQAVKLWPKEVYFHIA